ncbi:heterokaryon incompatibility protein-domain-containing protein [Truncatella angustata]|uniref:Heterokaryon incompatibility protein-domain-containing protein n=1 Tax=Truncatella angustata TaxID=152316 RepID=A0A9P8RKP7_9PEZI|nr:heterokaryon incompatibility protein-domain-containing protein [Truncatella angustata]KAH6647611.1 heterokaryon incompatibility protein-domain-containing protein [Truncatella angustata]
MCPPTGLEDLSDKQYRLLRGNIEAFVAGQPVDDLPQSFQDAVGVARSMQIRYLWIDCLCIIQDSEEDWETQSLEMREIYAHSICNISATGVPHNSMGFTDMLNKPLLLPAKVHPSWAPSTKGGWVAIDVHFWWAEVWNTALMKRGWVFQERFLPPRVLHFGSRQMLWECATVDACEIYPNGLPQETQTESHVNFKRLDIVDMLDFSKEFSGSAAVSRHATYGELLLRTWSRFGSIFSNTPRSASIPSLPAKSSVPCKDIVQSPHAVSAELLHFWCNTVSAYTRTRVTKPDDKLIALAGVAEMTSLLYHRYYHVPATYYAGLFDPHLIQMLEWHGAGSKAGGRALHYRAPSWSWASVEYRVLFEFAPRMFDAREVLNRRTTWESFIYYWNTERGPETTMLSLPTIQLDWKSLVADVFVELTQTTQSSEFGQVSDGHLSLRGLVCPLKNIPSSAPFMVFQDDPYVPIQDGTYCLPLRCIILDSEADRKTTIRSKILYWVTGLLLKSLETSDSTFRRAGLFCIFSSDGFNALGIEIGDSPFDVRFSERAVMSDGEGALIIVPPTTWLITIGASEHAEGSGTMPAIIGP